MRLLRLFFLVLRLLFGFLDNGFDYPLVLDSGHRDLKNIHLDCELLAVFRDGVEALEYHAADRVVIPVIGDMDAQLIVKILD